MRAVIFKAFLPPFVMLCLTGVSSSQDVVTVQHAIDCETLLLDNGERTRLIGVAPLPTQRAQEPTAHFHAEASEFIRRMAEGKRIRLEYDRQRRDAEGRLLAYVYLMDGTFLNAEIIRSGYAKTWTASPFRFLEQFRAYEKEARELKRGLWADRRGAQEKELIRELWIGSRDSKVYHYPYCAIAQKIGAPDQRLFDTLKGALSAGYAPCTVCGAP